MNVYLTIFYIIMCHLIGDYVLQCDFIAQTKGENWYHLFVHSALYCLPFYFAFGLNVSLVLLLLTHFLIDAGKAKYKAIDYTQDQVLHYFFAIVLYFIAPLFLGGIL